MEKPEEISSSRMFGGYNRRFKHFSPTLGCSMTFSIYFPPTLPSQKIPIESMYGPCSDGVAGFDFCFQ
ncbi:S-formylglutathione hydrolase [Dendrobium catenatum]|uniref:S-formylglutathione hydrolase n=1 Tax=Dendrobium catenatum TaxID=906689 RepID=A0A2I0XDT3_9ASPA|nr:S-formylglutathione hydrolase [Dendrobium catenatum]